MFTLFKSKDIWDSVEFLWASENWCGKLEMFCWDKGIGFAHIYFHFSEVITLSGRKTKGNSFVLLFHTWKWKAQIFQCT